MGWMFAKLQLPIAPAYSVTPAKNVKEQIVLSDRSFAVSIETNTFLNVSILKWFDEFFPIKVASYNLTFFIFFM